MAHAELKNAERELYYFHLRVGLAGVVVLVAFALLFGRLVYLQVIQHEYYRTKADDNRIAIVPVPPNRGLILDRNGVVLARNYSAYTIEVPARRAGDFDRIVNQVSELVEITSKDRSRFKKLLAETRNTESLPIKTRLSDDEVARFAANRFRFPGVEIRGRLFRQYPYGDSASHVIGYIGRLAEEDETRVEKLGDEANYRGTDFIGKTGIESSYERELHGICQSGPTNPLGQPAPARNGGPSGRISRSSARIVWLSSGGPVSLPPIPRVHFTRTGMTSPPCWS